MCYIDQSFVNEKAQWRLMYILFVYIDKDVIHANVCASFFVLFLHSCQRERANRDYRTWWYKMIIDEDLYRFRYFYTR